MSEVILQSGKFYIKIFAHPDYTVSQKGSPTFLAVTLKKNCLIFIIFGKNITWG